MTVGRKNGKGIGRKEGHKHKEVGLIMGGI